jgi:hypothetical protein
VIQDSPGAVTARLASALGQHGYTLRSQTDEVAVFNREETKWAGIAGSMARDCDG